ncbi:DUF4974 domain-containing protein [Chitinophaga agrisoli]|uniref:DUF4974 domain-containing protein n=1 Tax=Chitinophaga agrisoli TaxID=2607653 RepID=A0A5B2VQ45_9BACT|nr:FecR domain-containing protein [Chitinophaga agrisoli]KAA2240844.1 DUF4974 domain-containing protein [Chitinophaga agrisoli]
MKITEALIIRFFSGECNEQERRMVKSYFLEHPEALQQYVTEESWDNFTSSHLLPEAISGKMLQAIRQQTTFRRRKLITRYGWAAAAAVLLSLGALTYYMQDRQRAMVAAAQPSIVIKDSLPEYKEQQNTTATMLSFSLSDGSRIDLLPHSAIRYRTPFGQYNRDIQLQGKASFHVAQNSRLPFTVYAGKLATTALGTVFTVTAFNADKDMISVRLLSGKVVVRPDSILKAQGVKSAYLAPGQELRFNPLQGSIAIYSEPVKRHIPANVVAAKHTIDTANAAMLTFNNEPLDEIFDRLSARFNTRIVFRQGALTGMRFTGGFNSEKESLMAFLETIGLLNHLRVYEKEGTIHIEE